MSTPSDTFYADLERAVKLQTGETLHLDYRTKGTTTYTAGNVLGRPLKVYTWNIERGYKLDKIIADLIEIDADIIALQEVDCGLSRSEYLETGMAIAKSLKLNYVYQCEFIELESDIDKQYFLQKFYPPQEYLEKITNPADRPAAIQKYIQKRIVEQRGIKFERTDANYQADYRKSTEVIATGTHGHDTKIQYHPTPLEPTVNTLQYADYFVQSAQPGTHGNAILTKFDISQIIPLNHQHHPYNWTKDGGLLNEPRIGERQTLCVVVDVPNTFVAQPTIINKVDNNNTNQQQQQKNNSTTETAYLVEANNNNALQTTGTTPVAVYTCHLELFCGIIDRLKIMSEIFRHYKKTFAYPNNNRHHGIVMGDFNTLAHSLARFSGKYCKDEFRWRSLGYTEAELWYQFVLDNSYLSESITTPAQITQKIVEQGAGDVPTAEKGMVKDIEHIYLNDLQISDVILTKADRVALANDLGFEEAFAANTETLTNYNGWFYGKLDYLLTHNMLTINKAVFNDDYTASDHRGLYAECYLKGFTLCDIDTTRISSVNQQIVDVLNKQQQNVIECKKKKDLAQLASLCTSHQNYTPQYLINPTSFDPQVHRAGDNKVIVVHTTNTNDNVVDIANVEKVYFVAKDQTKGYYKENKGVVGYCKRNCTPYTVQVLSFAIPAAVAFVAAALTWTLRG